MRQTEHVLYITLIDFLLQLLFLGLVVGVIFAIAQKVEAEAPSPSQEREAREQLDRIKQLTGISDITVLTDKLTRLGPLQLASKRVQLGKEIEQEVDKAGGPANARKILSEFADKLGQGKPSCLDGGAILAVFDAYPDRIELRPSPSMEGVLSQLGLTPSDVARLSLSDFRKAFGPITAKRDCRYNIELVEHSFDTRPRDAVRSAFTTWKLTPAPDRR